MAGLTQSEAAQAMIKAGKGKLDADAAKLLAAAPAARNWLDLQALIDACINEAITRGEAHVTLSVVGAVLAPEQTNAADIPSRPAPDDNAIGQYLRNRTNEDLPLAANG